MRCVNHTSVTKELYYSCSVMGNICVFENFKETGQKNAMETCLSQEENSFKLKTLFCVWLGFFCKEYI